MLNHVRTLLLNLPAGPVAPWAIAAGEEAVDPSFVPLSPVPTYLAETRARLFGATPDRSMLNYRLAQLLPLLHETELESHVLALDPRVTYRGVDPAIADSAFAATTSPIVTYAGTVEAIMETEEEDYLTTEDEALILLEGSYTASTFRLFGTPATPDPSGLMHHAYDVRVGASGNIRVDRVAPGPRTSQTYDVEHAAGVSGEPVPLGDSGYMLQLINAALFPPEGERWLVSFLLRPQWDPGQLLASFDSIGEPTLLRLFGAAPVEPYRTFKACFERRRELPYRMGGLLLSLAYRSEEARRSRGGAALGVR